MEAVKTPYFSDSGELVGLIGIARDITERKKTEDNLRQARREAEQASQAKSDFLANMSHEIRTPMNGILGLCYLACREECSPELWEYLLKIEGSAKRLMGVINDILDFSKIEAGRMTIERTRFRLRDIVENVLTLLRPGAEVKGVELCCETAPELPEHFGGDLLRVQQILLNLGGNAVKFTATGGVLFSFSWLQKEGQGAVEIVVEDTGIGMDQASLGRLFLPFSQADTSTTRRYGGTGLGLASSRDLVELTGGAITVAGKTGRGAQFVVRLPLSVADPPNMPKAEDSTISDTDAAVSAEALQGVRILLAERPIPSISSLSGRSWEKRVLVWILGP